jgi:D-3-phosphoglycerate dehydrogenase
VSAVPKRIVVTTAPFGAHDRTPLELAAAAGIELAFNPLDRRLQPAEVLGVIKGFPVVVAGTEPITSEVMAACPDLKAICRVGIGLDSVDLISARRRGIAVSYTPDGPSAAVGELTIGLMIDLLRGVNPADRGLRAGKWIRHTGLRLANAAVGVLGVGRIGRRVIRHLQGGFPGVRILANDLVPDRTLHGVEWVDKETIYRQADIVTVHLPLTAETAELIAGRQLAMMKPTAILVNTARGGIVNEMDLGHALGVGTIRAAAIDVFCDEPYRGPLAELPNALLTCHMGSMTTDCRARMEIEATQEAIRFLQGEKLLSPVPDEEYVIAERRTRA